MSTPVTDDQVATLRALLADDTDRYRQLFAGLDRAEAGKGYTALIAAGFAEAALRRFGSGYTPADIITFVGALRARSGNVSEALDPARPDCCSTRPPATPRRRA